MESVDKYTVVGLGELLWDLLPGGKQPGGAPANFVFHAQNLGANAFVVTSVGDDVPGKEIVEYFRKLDISTNFIQIDKHQPTGVVEVKIEKGDPDYDIKVNVAWDFIKWRPQLAGLAQKADAVCFGSLAQRSRISRNTILRFLKTTRPGCLRIFDVNLRQNFFDKELISESLNLASFLKLNEDELAVISTMFSLKGPEREVVAELIGQFGIEMVALTKGANGSMLKTKDEESFLEVPKVEIIDTVGAGDAFTAALIMARLNKKPLCEVHSLANEVAAFVCTRSGATPRLPDSLSNWLEH